MHQKITEMATEAPNATMAVTGHSFWERWYRFSCSESPLKKILPKSTRLFCFQGPDARRKY